MPPPPVSAFGPLGLRSLWLGLLAVKILETDNRATTHPWHLTSGAPSFPVHLPALLFPVTWWLSPCLCLSLPLELGKCILCIKAASCKQHFPWALWPAGVSSSSKHLPAQQGRATLQPASPKQQDVANQVLRERVRRAGGACTGGPCPECSGWAAPAPRWHLALPSTSPALSSSPCLRCKDICGWDVGLSLETVLQRGS